MLYLVTWMRGYFTSPLQGAPMFYVCFPRQDTFSNPAPPQWTHKQPYQPHISHKSKRVFLTSSYFCCCFVSPVELFLHISLVSRADEGDLLGVQTGWGLEPCWWISFFPPPLAVLIPTPLYGFQILCSRDTWLDTWFITSLPSFPWSLLPCGLCYMICAFACSFSFCITHCLR